MPRCSRDKREVMANIKVPSLANPIYDGPMGPDDHFRVFSLEELEQLQPKVSKRTGYEFSGRLVSIFFKLNGEVRVVAESTVPGASGMLHIYNLDQLEVII